MAHYDEIGGGYDRTRRADPHLTSRLLAGLRLPEGAACLDAACGTGNYTLALAEAGLSMTGVDISARMLAAARSKAAGRIALLQADIARLPLRPAAFDGAVCTLALHHLPALPPVFAEIRRVLRAGRLVLLTSAPEQTRGMWLHAYFPALIERAAAQMPAVEQIEDALHGAGFGQVSLERYEVAPDLQDLFLYSGKHRPELYFDPRVRAGISSFATAPAEEVDRGLQRLRRDIDSGAIQDVIARARHDAGDYLFLIAETE